MITIVGTGHVFDLSGRIYHLVQGLQPDLVAVELDSGRHKILEMQRRKKERGETTEVSMKMLFKPSPVPFRFRLIALLQNRLAAAHDVLPGEEMLSAIDAARSIGVKIALIDRDINKTIESLSKSMSFKEKIKFYYAILSGFRVTVGRREKGRDTSITLKEMGVERNIAREPDDGSGEPMAMGSEGRMDKEIGPGKGQEMEMGIGRVMEKESGDNAELGTGNERVKENDVNKGRPLKRGFRSKFGYFFGRKSTRGSDPKAVTLQSQIEMIERDYDSVILELSKEFPGLKKALIDERDMNMANALMELSKSFGNIIAFVGEAHVEGMKRIMETRDVQPKIIHLTSLLGNSSSDVSFQITID